MAARDVWLDVVENLPADWFEPVMLPVLEQYCRHVVEARRLNALIVQAVESELGIEDYGQLLRMRGNETREVGVTSSGLRNIVASPRGGTWESHSFSVRSSARSFGRFTTTPPGRAQPSCRWAERTRRRVFARPVQERGAQREVRDYFVQGRRGWVRLHEKGGKEHEVPCHHNLERYLDEYIAAAGIAEDPDAPLFQTAAGRTGQLTGNALWQQDAYRMIQRRAKAAGIQNPDREPYLPRHRHHRLPEEQRHARDGAAHRQPRVATDHQALRPPAGGDFAG